jgi:hypothetical protein
MQKEMLKSLNKLMKHQELSDVTVVTDPLKVEEAQPKAAAVPQSIM